MRSSGVRPSIGGQVVETVVAVVLVTVALTENDRHRRVIKESAEAVIGAMGARILERISWGREGETGFCHIKEPRKQTAVMRPKITRLISLAHC